MFIHNKYSLQVLPVYFEINKLINTLNWLPIEHCSFFQTALLVYKFLHSGYPKYFVPFLKPRHSVCKTNKSQADGVFFKVPHFVTSAYKSTKNFDLSFAYDYY